MSSTKAYKVDFTARFKREFKRLNKRYRSLPQDVNDVVNQIKADLKSGTPIKMGCFKHRVAIESKNRGTRGGGRLIAYVWIDKETVYLLTIYDKSEKETVTDAELAEMLRGLED